MIKKVLAVVLWIAGGLFLLVGVTGLLMGEIGPSFGALLMGVGIAPILNKFKQLKKPTLIRFIVVIIGLSMGMLTAGKYVDSETIPNRLPEINSVFPSGSPEPAKVTTIDTRKFGLTLLERQLYFKEIVAAEDRARAEIESKNEIIEPWNHDPSKPFDADLYEKQFMEREGMIDDLSTKYKKEVRDKRGLTKEQGDEILVEAHSNGWALE